MSMKVNAHVLRDIKPKDQNLGSDEFGEKLKDEDMLRNRVAFTSLLYYPNDQLVYCGITAYDADIFYTFDPQTAQFNSLGYQNVGERFEVKIHRSLVVDEDGTMYGATACLHDLSLRREAPGGKVFKFDPASGRIDVLATPSPPDYIQTISLDTKRKLIYGMTYPVFKFFKYDLKTGETTDFDYLGSITHISALDDKGRFWGTWHPTSHYLFNYDPDEDRINFLKTALPMSKECSSLMYHGAGPIDSMINGGDGYLYIGLANGMLLRLDPEEVAIEFLGKPCAEPRMPGLTVGRDGLLYGCGGDNGTTYVFTYDRDQRKFETLGKIGKVETRDVGTGEKSTPVNPVKINKVTVEEIADE